MKTLDNIFFFLIFSLISLVSCTVESPQFIVKGVQMREAILFLQEFQKGEKSAGQLNHYIKYFRNNYAPGFTWDKYWSEIKEKKLYKALSAHQLNQMLSLSDLSCQQKDRTSFVKLLLRIAESDSKVLLFSQQLAHLRKTCFSGLPHSAFKSIVQFLSKKRAEAEVEKIKKVRNQLEIQNKDQVELIKVKYIYTEELQRLLIDEWFEKRNNRIWNDTLDVVDRSFWSDARWINYQNKNRGYLKKTLQIEWNEYQSITDLSQDIFLMFKENNKMADIMSLINYKKYFAVSGILNWSSLWNSFLVRYPEKPENDNVRSLLSLYSFSCRKQDLSSYSQLVKQWKVSDYDLLAIDFCVNAIIADVRRDPLMSKISEEELNKNTPEKRNTLGSSSHLGYEALEILLKSNPSHRTVQSVAALLFLYEQDQYVRSADEWKKLISYFSEEDWLNIMRILRNRYDRRGIGRILDMHNQVYQGQIPFLIKDIFAFLRSEKESVWDMVDKYGYKKAYMNNPHIINLFWKELEKGINQKEVVDLWKQNDTGKCSYSYLSSLFRFFSHYNKKRLLFSSFSFESCSHFIEKFKKREWIKLVGTVERANIIEREVRFVVSDMESDIKYNSEREMSFHFVWWLARVLSLYSSPLDSRLRGNDNLDLKDLLLKQVISKISVSQWEDVIRVMFESLKEPEFRENAELFKDTIHRLNAVYMPIANRSVCHFFGQKDSHFLIQKYDSIFIVDLLNSLNWSKLKLHNVGRGAPIRGACGPLASYKKVNTILFVLTYSMLESIGLEKRSASYKEYVDRIWNQTYKMVKLFAHIGHFDQKWSDYFGLERFFRYLTIPGYSPKIEYMSDSSFHFYFAALVLQKFQVVANTKKEIGGLLDSFFNLNPPLNVFDRYHREWMKVFMKDLETDKKVKWDEKLNMLKEILIL